jgi:hypothetical protein
MEGVFPFDGVLLRIEVKSKLTRPELKAAILAARDVASLQFCSPAERTATLPISAVFAFGSDLVGPPLAELERLMSVVAELDLDHKPPCTETPGPIGVLCVVGRGCWTFGRDDDTESCWSQAKIREPHDEVLHFVGCVSNTCFAMHRNRDGTGENQVKPVGGGIGLYIMDDETYERVPAGLSVGA